MDWLKKHTDTVMVLGTIVSSILWMNGRFNEIDKDMALINKDMAVIKAVLIMRQIMPVELAQETGEK